MALAFYFVNLQDSYIETDLTIARDKVAGVLLGILVMGFVFDRFGTKSDAEQLKNLLVQNVRMLAQLVASPRTPHEAIADSQIRRLRSQINESFASLESQTDAVRFEFEFRRRGEEDIAQCRRIKKVQPALRSIYLLELSLLSHRGRREVDSQLTEEQDRALCKLLHEVSNRLMHVAAWIAQEEGPPPIDDDFLRLFEKPFENHGSPDSRAIDVICQKMIASFLMLRSEC